MKICVNTGSQKQLITLSPLCSGFCHLSVSNMRVPGALPPSQHLHRRQHLLQEEISGQSCLALVIPKMNVCLF